jgi:hypothetical protein
MDRYSGVDGSMSLSDVGNYAGMSDAERELRGSVASVVERFSSYNSIDDLMREDPLDIEYKVSSRGDITGVELAITLGGPGIYVELPRGIVRGYWAGDEVNLDIRNPRGTDWMFDFYAEMAPMNQ